jgi:hypothetical protein
MTDEHGSLLIPGSGTGCTGGHPTRPAPDVNPVLGMVPARSSTWFGGIVLLLAVLLANWLLPDAALPWIALGLAAWFLAVVLIQLALGHRRSCLLRRSVRWFLGPVGALLDPFDFDD